jgi:hypothetical protein
MHPQHDDPPGQRHPKGTLAIVAAYGLLFALGWLAVYLFIYRARGGVFE